MFRFPCGLYQRPSLPETFILSSSSSSSCHDRDVTWQEISRTCSWAYSCLNPGSRIVVPLSEYILLLWKPEELNKLFLMKVSGRNQNVKVKMFGCVEVIVIFVITNQTKNMFQERDIFHRVVCKTGPLDTASQKWCQMFHNRAGLTTSVAACKPISALLNITSGRFWQR